MIDYTTEQSKDFILTCLIIASGLIDILIGFLINLISNYLTNYLQLNYFNIYSPIISFLLILFASYIIVYKLFDRYIWNKKPMSNLLNIPNLNGKWKGYTETEKYGKKDFNVTIEQTWTKIDMRLKTNQSNSYLISFSFNNSKEHDIFYTYYSEVEQNQEINSHYGTCILDIDENNDMLKGAYFTNGKRKTYGKICLKRIK
ncbi:MAG: hypothetical protein Q4Q24_01715 [Methanobrevibacter ruminantium]|uniref:Cap15 family cyclic dinucleotide receptor domain-containing protein n=1 Tax=Methanobrevibacter ruminantium TaxID=83816 RepID=UPI0026F17F4E|nr:hypothetical protein [Methanobrevibacter ruminantium]MDO5841973.1 hypothetical protein [Methanobrevibacter ruminantium]